MSQDEKDDDKNFLSRWSQRKRDAKLPDTGIAAGNPSEETEAPLELTAEGAAKEPFDLSSLPKLEEITETTDITVFLRKGVPESLRNAALRKSWALDPAIRNYVNPALDYAYDWNTPGGVPGNNELAAGTDVAKMVLQIMGSDLETSGPQRSDASSHSDGTESASASGNLGINAPQNLQADLPTQQPRLSDHSTVPIPASVNDENLQQVEVESSPTAKFTEFNAPQQEVRRHGTAKPRV
jgi:hypothetical protein